MAVRVKICGLKTEATLRAALDAGAGDVGLVFFANSPRNVAVAEAAGLAEIARGRARIVALTVDADDRLLDAIVRDVRPGLLQLHGQEMPDRCRAITSRWSVPVMKAIGVGGAGDAERALAYVAVVDLILFDAKPPKDAVLPGGNGLMFDWQMIKAVADKVPYMLSGGLTPANVAEAIRVTGARAVDVSSGVETAPGIKDPGLIRAFVAAAKSAHRAA